MSPIEKEHIIASYAFELSKCYEDAIKERQLQNLADIDPVLCSEVATALGMPAPDPTIEPTEQAPSPALSQIGGTWPVDGRTIGIVVDPDGDLDGLENLRADVLAAGMVPLVVAPHGGTVGGVPVQRTFATARSVEFDVLLLAGRPTSADSLDPRVQLMIDEVWRQAKAIGVWGEGKDSLEDAGYTGNPAGVVTGDAPADVFAQVQELMGSHRVWERFPASVS